MAAEVVREETPMKKVAVLPTFESQRTAARARFAARLRSARVPPTRGFAAREGPDGVERSAAARERRRQPNALGAGAPLQRFTAPNYVRRTPA